MDHTLVEPSAQRLCCLALAQRRLGGARRSAEGAAWLAALAARFLRLNQGERLLTDYFLPALRAWPCPALEPSLPPPPPTPLSPY